MERRKEEFLLSDDKELLDLSKICALLRDTYWAAERTPECIRKSIENSLCLGLYRKGELIGFARAITDYATFTYFCDVIIDSRFRNQGLGKWMMESFTQHPLLQTKSQTLVTKDAHALYARYGFSIVEFMKRTIPPAP